MKSDIRPSKNCTSSTASDLREIGSASVISDSSDCPIQTQDYVRRSHEAATDPLDCTEVEKKKTMDVRP